VGYTPSGQSIAGYSLTAGNSCVQATQPAAKPKALAIALQLADSAANH